MAERAQRFRRSDTRKRTQRDVQRFQRRDAGGGFLRSLALIGSVGWPIVLLSTGGALAGRYVDGRFGTGVRFTLMLLTVGTLLGSLIAYRTLRGEP